MRTCMLRKILSAAFFFIGCTLNSITAEEHYFDAPGAKIFCEIEGSGTPILVLHGGAGFLTHDYLRPHFDQLAKDNRIIYYDQRGIGKSGGELSPEQINIQTYLEDIETIRRTLGVRKIILLGHSWGSFLALHYAMVYPDCVDKLILTSSMPASSEDLYPFFAELSKRLSPYKEILDAIESTDAFKSGDPGIVAKKQSLVFQTYMYLPKDIEKVNLWISQEANQKGQKVWDIFRETIFMKPFNFYAQLKEISCPTLIIHGADDVIPIESAEKIHNSIPNSRLVIIKECGHFPFVEQPGQHFDSINEFLQK